jgi:ABC-type polysaccharide/polyol phosphate transport system ATPase subunit
MSAIKKVCNRVMWLDEGEIRLAGEPEKVVEEYLSHSG